MPLRITHRRAEEVPSSTAAGKVNPDLPLLKAEMSKLPPGMVIEIVTDNERAVRGTKMLISKAAKELGAEWRHWSSGATVYAQPKEAAKRRGRRPKVA